MDNFKALRSRHAPQHLRVRQQDKGLSQQSIACEYRNGFTIHFMVCRLTAPQIIIVHRRQVIVNQGVTVDHFNGGGGRQYLFDCASDRFAGRRHQHGPNAFTTGKYRIAHRIVQTAGQGRRIRQISVECGLNQLQACLQVGVKRPAELTHRKPPE